MQNAVETRAPLNASPSGGYVSAAEAASGNGLRPPTRPFGRMRPRRIRDIALHAVAATVVNGNESTVGGSDEARLLASFLLDIPSEDDALMEEFEALRLSLAPSDEPLIRLAIDIGLTPLETLAVSLAASVDDDPLVGRLLSHVQQPVARSRPTLGLIARALGVLVGSESFVVPELLAREAVASGLLAVAATDVPLPERTISVPMPLSVALAGRDGRWPNATIDVDEDTRIHLTPSYLDDARRHASALKLRPRRTMVLRATSPAEARSVAAVIAYALDLRPVFLEGDRFESLGPWLILRRLLPVLSRHLSPGDVFRIPRIEGYAGPVIVATGPDGSAESASGDMASWTLTVPPRRERRALWWTALADEALAVEMADQFRHGAGRIAHLARLARHQAALDGRVRATRDDLSEAAWFTEGPGLDALAHPLRARVSDDAMVTDPALQRDLDALVMRCRLRNDIADGLGVSTTTRYRPGLRALFSGPSGTGKTLAAGWVATQLGLPLYRVDLAAVTSKYIGETEKNLSQLLARAEQAEVILLFDEADSLFGKRTDVSDANDRFANAQTNYLLQRIENYDGIVLLTSNSQTRFDPAFARRLDFTIEFALPGPEERLLLWASHLGHQTDVTDADCRRLAAILDLNGGHIRNAVLTASVAARHAGRPISFDDVVEGVAAELRKMGRQMPIGLRG